MIFSTNILSDKNRIEKIINKYGYAPEHNYDWYACQSDKGLDLTFAESNDGAALFTTEEGLQKCSVFSSPIAPPSRRVEVIIEYLENIFKLKKVKKVELELETDLHKSLLQVLPNNFKARRINFTLTWPIYNLTTFDDSLSGGQWKKLRKLNNKFYRDHSIKILDAKTFEDKNSLHNLVDECKKNRVAKDRAYFESYHKFIENNFEGADEARIFIVDGKVCGINAGWKIINSNTFYSAIVLHNYSLQGLGEAIYIDNLIFLKNRGYQHLNIGGGHKEDLVFKNKFHPESFYKTHYFCIIKK